MKMAISLGEFGNEILSSAERFKTYWKKNHEENPDAFPLEMDPGKWDEQYDAWRELPHEQQDQP
jgi:endo-alpha-1,4-polygalactosaminidase (GH114 family)